MATKKQTSNQSTTTRKTNTRTTKKECEKQAAAAAKVAEAQKRKASVAKSIALFAVGLLFIVMLFVPGQFGWAVVRTFFFGVFGISFYFVGVAFLYFAVLIAQQAPWVAKAMKVFISMAVLSSTAILFSSVEIEGLGAGQVVAAFYQNGAAITGDVIFGGGVLGLVLGAPLLAFCGRPAANILMIILLLCAIMLLTGISPAELFNFVSARLGTAKVYGDKAHHAMQEKQAQRAIARAEQVAAQEAAAQEAAAQAAAEQEARQMQQPVMPTEEELELDVPVMIAGEPEDIEPKPWLKLFGRETQPEDLPTAEQAASRVFFDIDLGPAPSEIKTGVSEPIEPIEIGPGGTFGLEAVRGVASVPLVDLPQTVDTPPTPPEADGFWQVPVEVGEDLAAPVVSVPVPAAPAAPAQTATTAAGGDGWISMEDEASAPSDSAEIANLAAAAMDKPALADAALATTPAVDLPLVPSYEYPSIDLFEPSKERHDNGAQAELKANAQKLVETLESFGVKTRVLDISRGPSVTRYELQPLAGVKISRITNLADDIALNLSVAGVRIEAPIPGKPAVGIEVPNRKSVSVAIRSILTSRNYTHMESPLTFALGKDIAGVAQVGDLCKMPHLLVAGSTGSGKSVCINSIIISFLFRASPEELKMILIDPKVVELAEYNGIPHLLMPVVTEPRKAAGALGSAVAEMEKRYRLFADNNVRDIKTYNKLAGNTPEMEKLPYIAIVIDELADLMMVSGKEVEDYICRIAQKARAAGMHLIVATQRPSVDVITGLIKANIPSRISFAVSSQIDSRTILDAGGAEKLLGMGDMLYMPVGVSKPVRIQGTYVKDEEISRVLNFLKEGGTAQYNEEMIAEMEKVAANQKGAAGASGKGDGKGDGNDSDPMLKQCAEVVIEAGQASTSLLQRRCKLGYARAARIMDEMEQLRIIGPYEGAKPRAVLVSRQQWIEMCMNENEGTEETAQG